MKVWVDVTTGTWGLVEDLRIVYPDDVEQFEEMSDLGRIQLALRLGFRVEDGS